MPQISTGKLLEWSLFKEIIGQLKPITADIVPYGSLKRFFASNALNYEGPNLCAD